jgi:hypothetical protein
MTKRLCDWCGAEIKDGSQFHIHVAGPSTDGQVSSDELCTSCAKKALAYQAVQRKAST